MHLTALRRHRAQNIPPTSLTLYLDVMGGAVRDTVCSNGNPPAHNSSGTAAGVRASTLHPALEQQDASGAGMQATQHE